MDLFIILKWPLLACLTLPWLLVYLGLHVVQREIIFVDLALAQVAALGRCVSLLAGCHLHSWESYAWSAAFTVAGAVVFTLTRTEHPRVPQEALIGIVYVVAAAAGILILMRSAGGKEELQRSLVGELLVVPPGEVLQTMALFVGIGGAHYVFRRKFLAISEAHEAAACRSPRRLVARHNRLDQTRKQEAHGPSPPFPTRPRPGRRVPELPGLPCRPSPAGGTGVLAGESSRTATLPVLPRLRTGVRTSGARSSN